MDTRDVICWGWSTVAVANRPQGSRISVESVLRGDRYPPVASLLDQCHCKCSVFCFVLSSIFGEILFYYYSSLCVLCVMLCAGQVPSFNGLDTFRRRHRHSLYRGKREGGEEPARKHQIDDSVWLWTMSGLTWDGMTELVSRAQILRREWGQGKNNFTCSANHEHD